MLSLGFKGKRDFEPVERIVFQSCPLSCSYLSIQELNQHLKTDRPIIKSKLEPPQNKVWKISLYIYAVAYSLKKNTVLPLL